jgi:hypothetical protein
MRRWRSGRPREEEARVALDSTGLYVAGSIDLGAFTRVDAFVTGIDPSDS